MELEVNILELQLLENPSGGTFYVVGPDLKDYRIEFDKLMRFVKRVQISFGFGDLVNGVLPITHNLNQQFPSSIAVYDNMNKKVQEGNYDYIASSANTGSLEIYQPITGTWKLVLKY